MTLEDFLEDVRRQGRERNMDFAWVGMFEYRHDQMKEVLAEAKIIWIDPGSFPKEFPPTTTQQMKDARQRWEEKWKIERCAEQPKPTTINLKTGKFLKRMPNIKIER
ncbi:hypothetical protein CPT_Seuss66 [Caulobacter phage Seuss]|uniref:Uncharacterized protein n=1 Tax=Caulobacter phage Seuss TaxID=1675601 RepID=A0A0K1LM47_9CAUD|nr:hypothetical protein HOR08_gp066 [Caulobacter phage Seuss]AKU43592.1 hypothetical protein CPT_Seuss66 [Caulobacter phage Seuss]